MCFHVASFLSAIIFVLTFKSHCNWFWCLSFYVCPILSFFACPTRICMVRSHTILVVVAFLVLYLLYQCWFPKCCLQPFFSFKNEFLSWSYEFFFTFVTATHHFWTLTHVVCVFFFVLSFIAFLFPTCDGCLLFKSHCLHSVDCVCHCLSSTC